MHENIRTFKAATVEDALAQIRREMGFDAVVVETKQVERRSLLPWVASRHEVEVRAARVPAQRRAQAERQSSSPRTLAAHSATASATMEHPRSRVPLSADLRPLPTLADQPAPPRNRITTSELSFAESPACATRIDLPTPRKPRPAVSNSSSTGAESTTSK